MDTNRILLWVLVPSRDQLQNDMAINHNAILNLVVGTKKNTSNIDPEILHTTINMSARRLGSSNKPFHVGNEAIVLTNVPPLKYSESVSLVAS